MAQISVTIKYLTAKNGKNNLEAVKARIDTNVRVDDFLDALKNSIKDLGRNQQLFLSVDANEKLDDLSVKDGDTIVIMPKTTDPIIIIER